MSNDLATFALAVGRKALNPSMNIHHQLESLL